jgi:DNA-directed DNA polymerase III PolC
MNEFVFLENHSVYSLCEGTIFISELVSFARSRGYRYLSLCDTNGFYGIMNFIRACRREGLRPIISSRLQNHSFSAIVVARNMRGYAKICSLITGLLGGDAFDVKGEILKGNAGDYYVITRDRALLSKRRDGIFVEINVLKEDYAQHYRYAKQRKIEPVLIYPVYFLREEDYRIHSLLRAIHHNKKLDSLLPEEVQSSRSYPKEAKEIARKYSFMEDAVANTRRIARQSAFDFNVGAPILPSVGPDFGSRHGHEYGSKNREGSFKLLKEICSGNLKKRYSTVTPRIMERLSRELEIIHDKGFADYFLIVHDAVKRSPFTCGRGSAAASLVSYLLFITHVDPIGHNLFFERFMNEARPDPPDIDVDFPWDSRDRILDYIFKKYTKKHSAMVSNHITFSVRSSVREVAKVYGVPAREINRVTKGIGYYYNKDRDEYENYNRNPSDSSLMKSIYRDAVRIFSMPRYLSVHCGGVVITPKPVYYYIPVQRAAKGVDVIQLEKDQAEDFGFVKIDILGNRSLSVVRDTLRLVEEHHGKHIEYARLNPLDDRETLDMLARGDTIGVFYVESPAMRQLQRKTGRGDYEHLVIHSSIIRPAANRYIREYIERLRGKPFKPLLPEMEAILGETYGIMCYQEDIMKIAMKVADFSIADATELRKVVSNRNKNERKLELKERFYKNIGKRGVSRGIIDQIWDMIESFSGYSFCKPHSASYALLSFKACFLKAHYPAEFMGAVLKNQGGYYSPLAYISEARRLGLKVEPPGINKSRREYFGRGGTVYIGFMQIKGLSEQIVKTLLKERENRGPFSSLLDFMQRTGASLSDTSLLIKAGCFRNVERYNVPQLVYTANTYRCAKSRFESEPLYGGFSVDRSITPPPLRDISYEQKIKGELESFGFIVSIHPMEHYRKKISKRDVIYAKEILRFAGGRVKVAGIMITAKTVLTKDERLMQFISFEDETAIYETVFFPEEYRKFSRLLVSQRPYILSGRVDEEFGVISLDVNGVECL